MRKIFGKTLCEQCQAKESTMTVAVHNKNENYPKLHNFCSEECKELWKKANMDSYE
ncbi:MAG: hypothetical protein LBC64_01565 [Fibromonadaceae bacterium]|jgi:hypothetical protein|nr:hypothetical protein [Fibromonadaceae bacterium]